MITRTALLAMKLLALRWLLLLLRRVSLSFYEPCLQAARFAVIGCRFAREVLSVACEGLHFCL